jgi:signal transduction histidine kinase
MAESLLAPKRSLILSAVLLVAASVATGAKVPPNAVRGLPFTRFYSFDEIGSVSAGARLTFDPIGRLGVMYQGAYFVLNDTAWLDIAGKDRGNLEMMQVVGDGSGRFFYGAAASWGAVESGPDDKLHPRSLVPRSRPEWTKTSTFTEIVTTNTGVYFSGWEGIVYLDHSSQDLQFFNISGVANLFALGDRAFVFSHTHRLQYIDVARHALHDVDSSPLGDAYIDRTAMLDQEHVMVASSDQRLWIFDGKSFAPWHCELGNGLKGRITSLKRLADGGLAIAVTGDGLYLISESGRIFRSLTDPEHQRITDLASREPGVLWVVTENGVEKVLYHSPVTSFGQRLGLPISWPQVVRWQDRTVVASGGQLYEASPATRGGTTRFQPVPGQPAGKVWAIAASGPHMLVGNADGVYARNEDGSFTPVSSGRDVARLVMTNPDFCYVISGTEIGALRWKNGRWTECAARVPGVGFPAVTHAAKDAAWIEIQGGTKVARVAFKEGRLQARIFDKFPWPELSWVNVGVVGDIVVLTAAQGERLFFDENKEDFADVPGLRAALNRAPFRIMRIKQDDAGVLWASHERGVLTMRREADDYRIDTTRFSMINDRNLNIQVLPGDDVWFLAGQSLYHVEQSVSSDMKPVFRPVLVTVAHGQTSSGVFGPDRPAAQPLQFTYAENSLSLRFFAGSYAFRRSPGYEFRLSPTADRWTSLGTGSLLTLPNLREGVYRVEVRLTDGRGALGEPLAVDFRIDPPWYRTWQACTLYGIGAVLAALGLVRWLSHRANARNTELEKLVQERTGQLKTAMERLNEETRNAATLAERDRLAGEIHDSVQQGLSGVMLQLDATLKLPAVTGEVRSRLSVARNMVSFTRHEVQHAIWDMESPLLSSAGLGDALKKISELISPGVAHIEISISGPPMDLPSATKHHLLRIVQEAITNAVRHADATVVTIQLVYEPDALALSVTDDGRGFNPQEVLAQGIGHFGLRGLRERARKIGGILEIRSAPGEGTSISIVVPRPATASLASPHAFSPQNG